MIVAHEFKVDPREVKRWSYADFLDALQMLAEKRAGTPSRRQAAKEQAQISALKGELG